MKRPMQQHILFVVLLLLMLSGCSHTQLPSQQYSGTEDESQQRITTSLPESDAEEDISWWPDWYSQEIEDRIINYLTPLCELGQITEQYCFSLADITEDDVPELFFGRIGRPFMAFYEVYSITDNLWIRPEKHFINGEKDKSTSPILDYLAIDDCRSDIFNNRVFLDAEGNKYYMGIGSHYTCPGSDSDVWEGWYDLEVTQYVDYQWQTDSRCDYLDKFSISGSFEYLPTATQFIYPEDIKGCVKQCILRYEEKRKLCSLWSKG